MATPTWPVLTVGQWNLIASGVSNGSIDRLDTEYAFYLTYVSAGDPAPTIDPTEQAPRAFEHGFREPIGNPSPVDVYIYPKARPGETVATIENKIQVNEGGPGAINDILDSDGNVKVLNRDSDEPLIIAKFNQVQAGTTLAVETAIEDRTVTVADATGFSVGDYLVMYSTLIDRYYVGYILGIAGNVLTVDTPLDAVYPVSVETPTVVAATSTNMNVDGSTTPQVFGLRGTPVANPLNLTFDITRVIFHCQTNSAVDLSTFGDIAGGLANGLILRRRNNEYNNIFNIKTNGDLAGICYDLTVTASSNPQQGQDGFYARLTFASQGKLGAVVRLSEGTDLEFLVQDDLTSLTLLEVIAEGHVLERQ